MEQKKIKNLEMHEHQLALEAIYEILKEKNILTDREFTKKLSEIAQQKE